MEGLNWEKIRINRQPYFFRRCFVVIEATVNSFLSVSLVDLGGISFLGYLRKEFQLPMVDFFEIIQQHQAVTMYFCLSIFCWKFHLNYFLGIIESQGKIGRVVTFFYDLSGSESWSEKIMYLRGFIWSSVSILGWISNLNFQKLGLHLSEETC